MAEQGKNPFQVKWRIENLRSWLQPTDDSLYSPQFLAETLPNIHWKLRLSRKWQLEEKYISLALVRDVDDDHPKPVEMNYELSLLACDGSPLKSKSCTTKFALNTVSEELIMTADKILGEKKDAYLPDGALTVCCKVWKSWSTASKGGKCSIRSVIGRKCLTLDGTIEYFNDKMFKTVNFVSPFSDISFISFDISLDHHDYLEFKRTNVECKCFVLYSCKLFVLPAEGIQEECVSSYALKTLLSPHTPCTFKTYLRHDCFNNPLFLKNGGLTLKLEITCYAVVESEYIENDNNEKKLPIETSDIENVNTSNSSPLDNDHLTESEDISCEIEKNESDEDECSNKGGESHLPSSTLKEDLASLFNERLFCDTKLKTDTETFPAHRNVLSARSPVFKKMFMTDMKEKAGECINVSDISSDTVRRLLHFLYTDKTGHLDMQSAKDLYIASDKYDIASLKKHCASFIKRNLSPANVCDVIVLADMHQDKDLESAAHEFVLTYDREVFGSEEWKLFMKNFSSLAAQVMYLKCMKE